MNYVDENSASYVWLCGNYCGGSNTLMDPCRSNIVGPDPCDPCGIDAYGCGSVMMLWMLIVLIRQVITTGEQWRRLCLRWSILMMNLCWTLNISIRGIPTTLTKTGSWLITFSRKEWLCQKRNWKTCPVSASYYCSIKCWEKDFLQTVKVQHGLKLNGYSLTRVNGQHL